jgi:hypothetical protein
MDDEPSHVWLGDLSGMEVIGGVDPFTRRPYVAIGHRCGWAKRIPLDGIGDDGAACLGNVVVAAVEERKGHRCE